MMKSLNCCKAKIYSLCSGKYSLGDSTEQRSRSLCKSGAQQTGTESLFRKKMPMKGLLHSSCKGQQALRLRLQNLSRMSPPWWCSETKHKQIFKHERLPRLISVFRQCFPISSGQIQKFFGRFGWAGIGLERAFCKFQEWSASAGLPGSVDFGEASLLELLMKLRQPGKSPVFSLMLVLEGGLSHYRAQAATVSNSSVLQWVALDSSKPGEPSSPKGAGILMAGSLDG